MQQPRLFVIFCIRTMEEVGWGDRMQNRYMKWGMGWLSMMHNNTAKCYLLPATTTTTCYVYRVKSNKSSGGTKEAEGADVEEGDDTGCCCCCCGLAPATRSRIRRI